MQQQIKQYKPNTSLVVAGAVLLGIFFSLGGVDRCPNLPYHGVALNTAISDSSLGSGFNTCRSTYGGERVGSPFVVLESSGVAGEQLIYPVNTLLNFIFAFGILYIAGLAKNKYLSNNNRTRVLTRKRLQQYRPSKKFIIIGGVVLAGFSLVAEIQYPHTPLRAVPPRVVTSEQSAPPGAVCRTDVASRTRGFPFLISAYTRSGCDSVSAVYPAGIFLNITSSFLFVYVAGLAGNRYLPERITKTNKP